MTNPATKTVAELLAQRLGLDMGQFETTIGADPLTAALTLSLLGQSAPEERGSAAATVRFVASMVGACPICLGEDQGCAECAGRGKPGCRQPDGEALIVWIARPLRRLGLCVRSLSQTATNSHNEETQ